MPEKQNPLSDFVDMVRREMARMVSEADELDMAHRERGRIWDLIRKYNPRHANDDSDTKPATDEQQSGNELEGEAGGPEIQDGDGS